MPIRYHVQIPFTQQVALEIWQWELDNGTHIQKYGDLVSAWARSKFDHEVNLLAQDYHSYIDFIFDSRNDAILFKLKNDTR